MKRINWLDKLVITGVVGVVTLFAFPFVVAAATNTEIIAIMKEVILGVLAAGAQAYCAAGVAALC